MMNLFLATSRKRKFKLWLLTISEFSFSFKIIQFILDNNYIFFKKIFEPNQLIGFLIFWILLSYVRGRYLLTGSENIFLKTIKDFKEIIIVSSIVLIFTFILKTLSVQDSFTSSNILLIYSILIPTSLINHIIFYFLFEKSKAKEINVFLMGNEKEIKYIRENLLLDKFSIYNFKNIKTLEDVEYIPDHLIVAYDAAIDEQNKIIIDYMYTNGVEIYSSITWCEKFLKRIPSELINLYELVKNQNTQNEKKIQLRLKRLGDIVLGSIILFFSIPIILFFSLLIWINDRGPIFYCQIREGLFGKPIKIIKLRTMKIDAEKDGPQWSIKNDMRITFIGKLLRRMRIDELPQIISVIKGEMSLIGPRPERPEFNMKLNKLIPNYHLRNYVKPGLSGWAQVNYPYGASIEDAKNKLSYDVYYIINFSCWIDLLILFKTARVVFSGIGSDPK